MSGGVKLIITSVLREVIGAMFRPWLGTPPTAVAADAAAYLRVRFPTKQAPVTDR